MSKRRAYRSSDVKNVLLEKGLAESPEGPVTVGLDVGKGEVFAVLRWEDGTFERPWRMKNPTEIMILARLLTELAQQRPMMVAMESTGTYGDPLRQALTNAGLDVRRVSGKAVCDYAEIFDGVSSHHDGKDAAIVAELTAIGKSWAWPCVQKSNHDAKMAYYVDWLDAQQDVQMLWVGRLESQLARHWPELTGLLNLTSVTLLKILIHYGGPALLAEDTEAAKKLAGWGRHVLAAKKIERIIRSAKETAGVKQNEQDIARLRQYATEALAAHREIKKARKELVELAKENDVIKRQANAVGTVTACVLWVALGDPRNYHCAEAYRKAMGLNLKERSSGKHQGRLKITKRGPAIVRRWLYFAALRAVQDPAVKGWFESKKTKDGGRGKGAVIGVARRLALAMYHVGVDEKATYEAWRLFPGRSTARRAMQQKPETVSKPRSNAAAFTALAKKAC